jgi:MYXO-CTERM domain-containing protein
MSGPRRRVAPVALFALLLAGSAPLASAQDIGDASVQPREGGSSTPFTVRPPDGATCPGDSADDGYRVNSFMVPAGVAPTAITFDGLGPTPPAFGAYETFREPLFDLETNSFVSAQTADAEAPREPGTIINIPAFSFGVYTPGDVPAGRYRIGIACTLLNEITTVWDAEIVVDAASDDEPAGIRWRVDAPAGAEDGTDAAAPLAALAVAVLMGAFAIRRRRRPQLTTTRMEGS